MNKLIHPKFSPHFAIFSRSSCSVKRLAETDKLSPNKWHTKKIFDLKQRPLPYLDVIIVLSTLKPVCLSSILLSRDWHTLKYPCNFQGFCPDFHLIKTFGDVLAPPAPSHHTPLPDDVNAFGTYVSIHGCYLRGWWSFAVKARKLDLTSTFLWTVERVVIQFSCMPIWFQFFCCNVLLYRLEQSFFCMKNFAPSWTWMFSFRSACTKDFQGCSQMFSFFSWRRTQPRDI